jgi:hypothetical protein
MPTSTGTSRARSCNVSHSAAGSEFRRPGGQSGRTELRRPVRPLADTGDISTANRDPRPRVAALVSEFDSEWLHAAVASDEYWWQHEFAIDHDPSGLVVESNIFRYRPRPEVVVRAPEGVDGIATVRVVAAASGPGLPCG